ncbi:MAG: hypothetical protein EBR53_07655, partial [Actinobacteria bacterium]|nr:hypothetical protein [Actinomycetota bacterium]
MKRRILMQIHPWQWSVKFVIREYKLAASFVRESRNHKASLAITLVLASVGFAAVSSQTSAQPRVKDGVQRVNIGLHQCATLPEICATADSSHWQTGDLNQNNSAYAEGQSVPYRAAFTDLTVGQIYKLTIGW